MIIEIVKYYDKTSRRKIRYMSYVILKKNLRTNAKNDLNSSPWTWYKTTLPEDPQKSSFFLIESGQIMRFFFTLVLKFSGSRSEVVLVFNMMSEMALIICSFIICLNDLIKRMSLIDLLAESWAFWASFVNPQSPSSQPWWSKIYKNWKNLPS